MPRRDTIMDYESWLQMYGMASTNSVCEEEVEREAPLACATSTPPDPPNYSSLSSQLRTYDYPAYAPTRIASEACSLVEPSTHFGTITSRRQPRISLVDVVQSFMLTLHDTPIDQEIKINITKVFMQNNRRVMDELNINDNILFNCMLTGEPI